MHIGDRGHKIEIPDTPPDQDESDRGKPLILKDTIQSNIQSVRSDVYEFKNMLKKKHNKAPEHIINKIKQTQALAGLDTKIEDLVKAEIEKQNKSIINNPKPVPIIKEVVKEVIVEVVKAPEPEIEETVKEVIEEVIEAQPSVEVTIKEQPTLTEVIETPRFKTNLESLFFS